MHLYSPNRPTIAHKRAFLGGMLPIPPIEIRPLEENSCYELSMMLPIQESSGFMAKRFENKLEPMGILIWLNNFKLDPENTIMNTWGGEDQQFKPCLSFKKSETLEDLNKLLDNL
jgi:hypothetical protein